jgi:hypothetical protein
MFQLGFESEKLLIPDHHERKRWKRVQKGYLSRVVLKMYPLKYYVRLLLSEEILLFRNSPK